VFQCFHSLLGLAMCVVCLFSLEAYVCIILGIMTYCCLPVCCLQEISHPRILYSFLIFPIQATCLKHCNFLNYFNSTRRRACILQIYVMFFFFFDVSLIYMFWYNFSYMIFLFLKSLQLMFLSSSKRPFEREIKWTRKSLSVM
jgi:hypothetical protein